VAQRQDDTEEVHAPLSAARETAAGDLPEIEKLRGCLTCSIETAAGLLGIGRSTAYAAARDGSLPTVKLSHRLLVPTAKLRAMLGVEEFE